MSGIAGILRFDGRAADAADLERLGDAVARRGRDARGDWSEGTIGLVHRAMQTTPESLLERQPLADPERRLVVVADARIDNRAELVPLLALAPDAPDAEVVLAAYDAWGEACAGRLVGDFAFAVWDARRRTLFCARDPFGARPLCYHVSGRLFAFASSVEALLRLDEVPRRLDEETISDYLSSWPGEAAATFFSEIRRLPPGHSMTVRNTDVRVVEHWALDEVREVRFRRDEEYADAFRDLFYEAVRCRMRASSPVGVTLSGGLDSSSVAAAARRIAAVEGGGAIHALSWVFDGVPECDEREFLEAVLAGGGLVPHAVLGDRWTPLGAVDDMPDDWDEPCLIQNMFLWRATYRAARGLGVRVVLDGHDGDSVVSHGTGYLDDLARRGQWLRLARETHYVAKRRGTPALPMLQARAREHILLPLWRHWRAARGRPAPEPSERRLTILHPRLSRRGRLRAGSGGPRHAHYELLISGFLRYATEAADATGAAIGVEPRHPFLDRRLVELCLALPPEQKLWRGWGRGVLRRAMAGDLPDAVAWRVGKTPLGAQFVRAFARDRALVEDVILRDPRALEAYVDVEALRGVYERYLTRRDKRAGAVLWSAVTLGLWLRRIGAG